jgi:hypothetical protein
MFYPKFFERSLIPSVKKILSTKSKSKIELKNFIDFDLDCLGWYAIGHHDSQDFLACLSKKGVNVKCKSEKYHLTLVQRIWVKIDSIIGIEEVDATSEDAIPITFIELFYD